MLRYKSRIDNGNIIAHKKGKVNIKFIWHCWFYGKYMV